MSKRIYIATSKGNKAQQRDVATWLASMGWEQTYDWTTHRNLGPTDGFDAVARELIGEELRAVERADVVVVLLPGGPGTHVELGAALAWRKPVFVLGTVLDAAPNGVPVAAYAAATFLRIDQRETWAALPGLLDAALTRRPGW